MGKGKVQRRPVPLEVYLRRRPRRRAVVVASVLIVLLCSAVADRGGTLDRWRDAPRHYERQTWRITGAFAADVFEITCIEQSARTIQVRLLGIAVPAPMAENALGLVHDLAADQPLRLTIPAAAPRDASGRLLVCVGLPDGSLLNERLLLAGYALADEEQAHGWRDRFALLEKHARRAYVGQWARVRVAGQ